MSSFKYTHEIFSDDYVGDSSAKHNYNLLSLDTQICNLSSQYFVLPDNFYDIFNEFAQTYPSFVGMSDVFLFPKRYNTTYATVNVLSAVWQEYEFSVHYPINISLLQGLPINASSVNQIDEKLLSLARTYIDKNYPANLYANNTKINVVFFLYNLGVNPNDPADLIFSRFGPEISYNTRHMYVEFLKQDVHLGNGKIISFKNVNGESWLFLSIETGNTKRSVQPKLTPMAPIRVVQRTFSEERSTIKLNISKDTKNLDLYYNCINTGIYYPGYTDVILTIESGVTVGCDLLDGAAITISGFYDGDTITIINNGNIVGYGGSGGDGQSLGYQLSNLNNGTDGGDAIILKNTVNAIINNGVIGGGGGGGSGGIAAYKTNEYLSFTKNNVQQESATSNIELLRGGGGGGGGAGYVGGSGGLGGMKNTFILDPLKTYTWTSSDGDSGNNGGLDKGGASGYGYESGGKGGDLGQDGISSGAVANGIQIPPLGGKAGKCIRGYSFVSSLTGLITQTNSSVSQYGIIYGGFV